MNHSTERAYREHLANKIPFPEDAPGGISCGCRRAHNAASRPEVPHRWAATCTTCETRCKRSKDGLCGDCRQLARRASGEKYLESEIELTGGEWVNMRGVMRWFPKLRSLLDPDDWDAA